MKQEININQKVDLNYSDQDNLDEKTIDKLNNELNHELYNSSQISKCKFF